MNTFYLFSKNSRSVTLALFLSITSLAALAQSTLEGVVVDEANGQKLEFSIVKLYRSRDSLYVTGTTSGAKGEFIIRNINSGNYYLAVQFQGYKTVKIADINVSSNQNYNTGTITLTADASVLKEVVVSTQKIGVDHQVDKQVYNAAQFQSAQGGTATDVIKNLPSVSVNAEGEISLRGSSSFIVLLDGKPTQADPLLILGQLPANSIENIEIITTPSSKYDPDGKAGIINILTKKGSTNGYYVLINAQQGFPSVQDYGNEKRPLRFGGDITTNIRHNKINASLSANYKREDIAGYREGEAETYIGDVHTTLPSVGERSYRSFSYSVKGNFNYQVNKSNSIEVGFYGGKRSQFRKANIVYDQQRFNRTTGELIDSLRYFNKNFRERKGDFAVATIDFNHKFSNKANFVISALYEKTILGGPTRNKDVNPEDEQQLYNQAVNEESNPLDGVRLKADYSLPVKSKGKFEVGYQYRYLLHRGDFTYKQLDVTNDSWFVRTDLSNAVKLTRQIHSVYTQYGDVLGSLSYSAGLRLEYVDRTLHDESTTTAHAFNRLNLFPSLNILYGLEKGYKLKAGYSRRIAHTTSSMMNPFPARRHSEVLETGDPDLLPEYIDVAEIGVVKDFNNNSVFANLYYRGTQNVINRVNAIYNDSILVRTFTNAGHAASYGLEVGLDLKPTKWWSIFAGGNLYQYSIKGSALNTSVNTNSINYLVNANTTFKIFPTVSLQLAVNYTSKTVTAQGIDSRFLIPSATLKKTVLKGQGSISVQWQNIDMGLSESNEQRLTTSGQDFYTTTNYIQEVDVFRINFSYQFNKLVSKLKFTESEFGEREF